MHPPRIFVLGTILGVLMSACSPAPSPAPTPTSVPSVPTCVPEFEGTPFPCTQAEFEANQKMLARYAEAERVYREYTELAGRELVDRLPEPSSTLIGMTTGNFRRDLADLRTGGLELAHFSGSMIVASVAPALLVSGEPGNLALDVCMDLSHWLVAFNDGRPGPTGKRADRVLFDDALGLALISDIKPAEGESCA